MKKIVLFMCILFVLMPFQAYAHSKLTESIPAADTTVQASPEYISLTFNTSISSASRISLLNENGDKLKLKDITVKEDTISGQPEEQLDNGSYTVSWNIIGADGHAIEGSYGFKVELVEAEQPEATEETTEVNNEANAPDTGADEPEVSAEPTPTEATDARQANDNQVSNESKQPVWPYIVIGIVIVAILAFALRKRK